LQDKEQRRTARLPAWALEALLKARVGHLACSTKDGNPLVIPICFAFAGSVVFTPIDEKPKRTRPLALRRVSNITENPNVCFIVDEYAEDWRKLQYVLVIGHATLAKQGEEFTRALTLLRKKYKQYSSMKLETRPLIRIEPLRIKAWKPTRASRTVKPKEYD
jgi:PPOX class probable F420-dependent enzyme